MLGRGKGQRLRMERVKERAMGWGSEMVKRKILLNKPQGS